MSKPFRRKANHLRIAIAAVTSGALLMGATASNYVYAQPVPDASADVEEIVVLGSRIRRSTTIENIVVTEVTAEQMDSRAFVNTIESLEQLPFVSVGVNNQGNSTQFGDNNAYVNLLNLGSQRTVTLVDGRRMVSSNQGTVFVPGNATGAQVDLSIINPSLIERTEVQTIGSGAVYGPDAIAGVVNVQLDRDFEGLEVITQLGTTAESDGDQRRLSMAWGSEALDGRAHVVLGAEYLEAEPVYYGSGRPWTNNISTINNPYSLSGTDGVANTVFQDEMIGISSPLGGRLDMRQINAGNSATFYFPRACIAAQTVNVAGCNAFTAQRGQSPWANGLAGGLNPMAFVGTFGLTSGFPTVPVQAGSADAFAGLTRVAIPLTFDSAGNPVPLALGSILPPNIASQSVAINAGGFDSRDLQTIQAGQDRYGLNAFFSYELTDSIIYESDFLYSEINNEQRADNFGSNSPAGSFTSGNAGIPIYYNQNPFVTGATKAQINSIIAANPVNPFSSLAGQPVFYLQRSLADVTGSNSAAGVTNFEGNNSTTFSTGHTLKQDFQFLDRDLYWEATLAYGRNESENNASNDILDLEFALATDVVLDARGNPVCRQQTLSAPEAVNVRNPFLTNLNIATGITPSKAQIDSCVPLNLFGVGAASAAAIDYVTAQASSNNKAEQKFASVQLGGNLYTLPAGDILFNTEMQWRREDLAFTPNRVAELGLARTTISQPGLGYAVFREAGVEASIPVFNGGFALPFVGDVHVGELRLDTAVRVVDREGEGTPNGIKNPFVQTDTGSATTFNVGGLWSPLEWISFRGNRSRSVRSPSIVETLGAPQTGFSSLGGSFPCTGSNRNSGPASGIRITNCDAFEKSLGLPAGTFAGLFPSNASVPAGVGGNPALTNEVASNWTAGFVIQPTFIEGLQIQADYLSVRLDSQIGLTFLGTQCFDQTDFPKSLIGGVSACEAITLGTGTGPGGLTAPFTIPTTNIITGNPIKPPAIAGAPAPVQSPYTIATAQFSNANQGSIRLQGINSRISYQFSPQDLLSPLGLGDASLGQMRVDAYMYFLNKFQTSSSGTFGADTNNNRGEPGYEKVQGRVDLSHRMGRFTNQLQWFYAHKSQVNIDINPTAIPEQNAAFFRPAYDRFNYNVSYEINDNLTARLVVNNLLNDELLPQYGLPGDLLGRSYVVRLDARF